MLFLVLSSGSFGAVDDDISPRSKKMDVSQDKIRRLIYRICQVDHGVSHLAVLIENKHFSEFQTKLLEIDKLKKEQINSIRIHQDKRNQLRNERYKIEQSLKNCLNQLSVLKRLISMIRPLTKNFVIKTNEGRLRLEIRKLRKKERDNDLQFDKKIKDLGKKSDYQLEVLNGFLALAISKEGQATRAKIVAMNESSTRVTSSCNSSDLLNKTVKITQPAVDILKTIERWISDCKPELSSDLTQAIKFRNPFMVSWLMERGAKLAREDEDALLSESNLVKPEDLDGFVDTLIALDRHKQILPTILNRAWWGPGAKDQSESQKRFLNKVLDVITDRDKFRGALSASNGQAELREKDRVLLVGQVISYLQLEKDQPMDRRRIGQFLIDSGYQPSFFEKVMDQKALKKLLEVATSYEQEFCDFLLFGGSKIGSATLLDRAISLRKELTLKKQFEEDQDLQPQQFDGIIHNLALMAQGREAVSAGGLKPLDHAIEGKDRQMITRLIESYGRRLPPSMDKTWKRAVTSDSEIFGMIYNVSDSENDRLLVRELNQKKGENKPYLDVIIRELEDYEENSEVEFDGPEHFSSLMQTALEEDSSLFLRELFEQLKTYSIRYQSTALRSISWKIYKNKNLNRFTFSRYLNTLKKAFIPLIRLDQEGGLFQFALNQHPSFAWSLIAPRLTSSLFNSYRNAILSRLADKLRLDHSPLLNELTEHRSFIQNSSYRKPEAKKEQRDLSLGQQGTLAAALKEMGFDRLPTKEELSRRWRKLNLIYHPDRNTNTQENPREQNEAQEKIKKINNARDLILRHL